MVLTLEQIRARARIKQASEYQLPMQAQCCVCMWTFQKDERVIPITGMEDFMCAAIVREGWVPYSPSSRIGTILLGVMRDHDPRMAQSFYSSWVPDWHLPSPAACYPCFRALDWMWRPENTRYTWADLRWVMMHHDFNMTCAKPWDFVPIRFIIMDDFDDVADLLPRYREWIERRLDNMLMQPGRVTPPRRGSLNVPLCLVERWERGEIKPAMLQMEKVFDVEPVMESVWCLTFDGTRLLEVQHREERQDPFSRSGDDSMQKTYAVLDWQEVSPIWLKFTSGFMTFRSREVMGELIRWDTPTPPDIKSIAWLPQGKRPGEVMTEDDFDRALKMSDLVKRRGAEADSHASQVFTTIDLTNCRGLIFFYDERKRFMGVCSQRGQEHGGDWLVPLEFIRAGVQKLYVPLAKGDEIEEFSCRGILNMAPHVIQTYHTVDFKLVTKLAGEVHVGPNNHELSLWPTTLPDNHHPIGDMVRESYARTSCPKHPPEMPLPCMSTYKPQTLLFSRKHGRTGVEVFGALPSPQERLRGEFNGFRLADEGISLPRPNQPQPYCFAEAPLRNVTEVRLRERQGLTVGLGLRYKNGAARDLGEAGTVMERIRSVLNPGAACLTAERAEGLCGGVDFLPEGISHDGEHDHAMCRPMSGLLKVVWDPSPAYIGCGMLAKAHWWIEPSDDRVFPTDLDE